MRLQGKVVVITGAASGIGASTAQLFAGEGARVVATDVQFAGLETVVEEIGKHGGTALALAHDVASDSGWRAVIEAALDKFGRIDVLLNNAGVGDRKSLLESTAETTDEADWDRVIDINLKGCFLGIKHVLPVMKSAGGGSIINVSSVAALLGSIGPFAYSASKGGVRSMTKHVAAHYGRFNIRANSIHPGGVKTPMIGEDLRNEDLIKHITAGIPLGRLSEPEEIARLALFLASDDSSYLTGAELVADGGLSIL